MDASARISLILGLLTIMVSVAAFGAFVWQLRMLGVQVDHARQATNLDHDRRRKQATIDFYASTLDKRASLRGMLASDRDEASVRSLIARAENDEEIRRAITEYLSLFELLATGVRESVFDFDVIKMVAGGRIKAVYSNYSPWIQKRRVVLGSDLLYEQLEWLAKELATPVQVTFPADCVKPQQVSIARLRAWRKRDRRLPGSRDSDRLVTEDAPVPIAQAVDEVRR